MQQSEFSAIFDSFYQHCKHLYRLGVDVATKCGLQQSSAIVKVKRPRIRQNAQNCTQNVTKYTVAKSMAYKSGGDFHQGGYLYKPTSGNTYLWMSDSPQKQA